MPAHETMPSGETFDLGHLDREMRQENEYERAGHAARTLVRVEDLRVVFVVMKAGGRIAEHKADETALVHVRSGQVRLRLPERTAELSSGQLLVMEPGLRHSVEAIEDSSFVLTLGWSAKK